MNDFVFPEIPQALATFIIFVLGYFANRSFEVWKENRRLKDLREYTLSALQYQIKPIQKQIETMITSAKSFKKVDDNTDYIITDIVNLDVKKFDKLNLTDLYKVFVTQGHEPRSKRIELFQSMERSIKLIDGIKTSNSKKINSFLPRYEKYKDVWNSNTKAIGDIRDEMIRDRHMINLRGDQQQEDLFFSEFMAIYVPWRQMENGLSPDVAHEHLILPLRVMCVRNIHDTRAHQLLRHCVECMYTFDNLTYLHDFMRRQIIEDAWNLRKCRNNIIYLLGEYDKKPSKKDKQYNIAGICIKI